MIVLEQLAHASTAGAQAVLEQAAKVKDIVAHDALYRLADAAAAKARAAQPSQFGIDKTPVIAPPENGF